MIKNRLLYLGLVVITFVFFVYTVNRVTLMLFLATAAFPPASLLLSLYSLRRLSVAPVLKDTLIYKGGGADYVVQIKNNGFLPVSGVSFNVSANPVIAAETSNLKNVELNPREVKLISVRITGRYRGFYRVAMTEFAICDSLGLFKMKKRLNIHHDIAVYPKVTEPRDIPMNISLINQEQARYDLYIEDYDEIFDIREYVESDPIKKIHWKLSAKYQDWIVKNYQTTVWDATAVIMGVMRAGEEAEDLMVETAVALGYGILRQNRAVSLIYGAEGRIDAHYIQDFPSFYTLLAKMEFVRNEDEAFPSGFLEDQLQGRNINMIILTTRLNAEMFAKIIRAMDFGHNALIAYARPKNERRESRQILGAMEKAGIPVVYLKSDPEAKSV